MDGRRIIVITIVTILVPGCLEGAESPSDRAAKGPGAWPDDAASATEDPSATPDEAPRPPAPSAPAPGNETSMPNNATSHRDVRQDDGGTCYGCRVEKEWNWTVETDATRMVVRLVFGPYPLPDPGEADLHLHAGTVSWALEGPAYDQNWSGAALDVPFVGGNAGPLVFDEARGLELVRHGQDLAGPWRLRLDAGGEAASYTGSWAFTLRVAYL